MRRVIFALIGVAAAFAALVVWLELGGKQGRTPIFAAGLFAGVLVAGFPVLYQCCKRHWWQPWQMTLLGSLGGGLCALPFAGGPFGFGFLLAIFLLAGTGLGLLFWLVAIWRNDDLTCPRSFCLPCGAVYRVARNALNRRRFPQSK
jgi:peptidoglycan/LPS O-acetylase OafA/YrhL